MIVASIPSPTTAVWHLGSLPIRAYALCIVAGIIVACVVTDIRLRRRGAPPYAVLDIALWAVPFGIVGARLYHVISSPQAYFGEGGNPAKIIQVWEGGLGIWGAVAGGALGAWIACRQLRLPFLVVADAAAVGLPLAQAVGRLGNWFNNELYGGETTLPWGLRVYEMDAGRARTDATGEPIPVGFLDGVTYHPTFLYEMLWNIGVAVLVWQVGKRLKLGRGRAFALYVMGYTAGRFWIEMMRVDDATPIFGVRVNVWVSALVFLGALLYFVRVRGSQEFLVPLTDRPGYQVVTEEEYAAYQAGQAGGAGPAAAGSGGDGAGGDGAGGDGAGGAGPAAGGDGSGDGPPGDRTTDLGEAANRAGAEPAEASGEAPGVDDPRVERSDQPATSARDAQD